MDAVDTYTGTPFPDSDHVDVYCPAENIRWQDCQWTNCTLHGTFSRLFEIQFKSGLDLVPDKKIVALAGDQITFSDVREEFLSALRKQFSGVDGIAWNTKPDGTGEELCADALLTCDRDVVYYAQWKTADYQFTFTDGALYLDFTSPIPNNSLVFLAAYTEDGQMDQILQAKRVDGRWKFSLDAAEADTSYKGFVLSDIRSPLRGALMLLE